VGGCSSGKQMEQPPTAFMTLCCFDIWFFPCKMSCMFLLSAWTREDDAEPAHLASVVSGRMGIALASIADGINAAR
jgi:hypothetical protein